MPVGVGASRYWSELARPDSKLQLRLSFDHLLCGRRETADRAVHAFNERSGGLGVPASHCRRLGIARPQAVATVINH
jgi:hypothetical protein